jgi:hypothetical protein
MFFGTANNNRKGGFMEKKVLTNGLKMALSLFFVLGCARVSLESKKPIKLDVTMRVDIYQHVTQDVQAIEDMISSPKKTSMFFWGIQEAYAQEGFPANVSQAIEQRKSRREELVSLLSQGVIGENAAGFVEVKDASRADSAASLVSAENSDRQTIYAYVAEKNGATVAETGKIFAKRIRADAPAGTPIQSEDGSWTKK